MANYSGYLIWRADCTLPTASHAPGLPVSENQVISYNSEGSYEEVVYCSVCGEEISRESKSLPRATLAAPVLTSVANDTKGVTVKWEAVEGAESYKVYRKVGTAKKWTLVQTVTPEEGSDTVPTSFTDTDVQAATKYTYTIKAVAGTNISDYDTTGKAATYYPAPKMKAPANAAAGVTVKWKASSGATKYRVYRMGPEDSKWVKLGDTTSLSYTDKTAESGVTYSYAVRGICGKILSGYSAAKNFTFMATPKVPTVKLADSGVSVKWSAVAGAEQYQVYRKVGTGDWTAYLTVTETSFTDTGVKAGKKYTYTVQAIGATASKYDTTGKSITYYPAPVLQELTANETGTAVRFTWEKSTGAAKYRVFRKTNGGIWVKLADTTKLAYKDSTVEPGVQYSYAVKALDSSGKQISAYSVPIEWFMPIEELGPIEGNETA